MRIVGITALTLATAWLWAACDRKGGGGTQDAGTDGGLVVTEWHNPDFPQRVTVTVNPHPDRDRVDLPVLALLEATEPLAPEVEVYEITDGDQGEGLRAGLWSQPNGTFPQVGFTAPGVTVAGESRTFLVYLRPATEPATWSGPQSDWATFAVLDLDSDGVDDAFGLSGGAYELQREINPSDESLRRGRRPDGDTFLKLAAGSVVAEGFSDSIMLETVSETFPNANLETGPITELVAQGDDFSAACAVSWLGRTEPLDHDGFLAYRVFADWPLLQTVVSVTPGAGIDDVGFTSSGWSSRTAYLTDDYDRITSDNRGEEALASLWDTSMRWLVLHDSATGAGVGWFLFHRGVVRAAESDGEYSVYDSYGYSAGGKSAYHYLWMAGASKDDIVDLFDAMVPGATVSTPENRDLNIVTPRPDDFYFPDDSLTVIVTTPGQTGSVVAHFVLPDGTELPVPLTSEDEMIWRAATPHLFDANTQTGTWVLAAQNGDAAEQVAFQVERPNHPKLLFGPEDLAAIRARKDDPVTSEHWEEMVRKAGGYDDPIPDPGPGKDIRSYAERLISLALIQLVDPQQPFEDLLWTYFFTMLRYPNWEEGAEPFNNLDLTVGHFLAALAITYDWHYDALTPAERQEVRRNLSSWAADWLSASNMRTYRDIDWHHFGTVTNNHYWINHMGVAAVAFVLADEMPEPSRTLMVNQTEENLSIILSVLEEDGASQEGVPYHSYGQINLFVWLDMRDRVFGENTAEAIPWFAQSVYYDLYSLLPGGEDNYGGVANFGDSPTRHYNSPRTIQSWLAHRLGNEHSQWMAESLDWPHLAAMAYLWYDPAVSARSPEDLPPFHLCDQKGIFAWRSSWENNATYLSLKSGSFFSGHEQPDAGQFILHRAGVPYLVDLGYSYRKMTDEHNVLLFDSEGQHGEGAQWMPAVDPVHWATVASVLADDGYFHVVADPTPMVSSPKVQSWRRELLGLGPDLFFVRDTVSATETVQVDFLLHSYVSTPPTASSQTYSYLDNRMDNPFTEVSPGRWEVAPQPTTAATALQVADLSYDQWTATVEPTLFVPEQTLDTREYNVNLDSYQLGFRLRRSITAGSPAGTTSSVMALWFGDTLDTESLTTATADAARLYTTNGDVAVVIWPLTGSVTSLHGFDVTGRMGGRRFDEPAVFGHQVTYLFEGGEVLCQSTTPVNLFARLVHTPTPATPAYAILYAAAQADLSLATTLTPSEILLDGTAIPFTMNGSLLTFTLPPGQHRIDLVQ
jgi:Heparinase II/III-like protein